MTESLQEQRNSKGQYVSGHEGQWSPGQSGNPGGRAQGESITAQLRALLNQKDKDGKSNALLIAELLIAESKKSSSKHLAALIKEVIDRTDGKVIDTHKFEGEIPVSIRYVLKDGKDD